MEHLKLDPINFNIMLANEFCSFEKCTRENVYIPLLTFCILIDFPAQRGSYTSAHVSLNLLRVGEKR